jgi:hypothetical protein
MEENYYGNLLKLAGNDDPSAPESGRCEVGETGKSDSELLDAYSGRHYRRGSGRSGSRRIFAGKQRR